MSELNFPGYDEIDECHSSNYGEELFYQNSWRASNLDPSTFWIPWVTINGFWNENEFQDVNDNLLGLMCSNYLKGVPECK